MNKIFNQFFSKRIYLLLALGWFGMCTTSCTYKYYTPSGTTSFTGTAIYCQGATASANTLHYSECSSGTGTTASGVSCTVQWYYNTTGGTSIVTSTPLGSSTVFTSAAGGGGTLSYTPLTTTAGIFYYFAYITWGSGYCASPFTSSTQTITINSLPGPITGTPTVCVGATTNLSEAASGGTWSSGTASVATVNSSGMVTGLSPGSSVISYATSCSPAATFTVTVLGVPVSIGGPSAVCPDASIPLTDATIGGSWSSGSPSNATVAGATGIVTGIMAGSTIITYSTGCGSAATKTITINPLPDPITGIDSVCDNGATTPLSDMTTGGSWSSSPLSVATVSPGTGIVTGILAGGATITYTSLLNCIATFPMTVDPSPAAITGAYNECVGLTTDLSDAVPGGVWSSSNNALATVNTTGVVTGIVTGTVLISYTNNCGSATALNYVKPLPGPIAGSDSVCALSSSLLSDDTHGGTWSSSNTLVATLSPVSDNSSLATGVSPGSATITYTLPTGCYITGPYTVIPLPSPIAGSSIGCPGETMPLTDAVIGGSWSSDDAFVGVMTNGTIGAVDTGIFEGVSPDDTVTIYYTMPEGCYVSTIIYVSTLPASITGITATCAGLPDTLTDDTLGGTWSTASSAIATISAAGVLTAVSAGSTLVTYTIPATGCYVTASELVHPLPVPSIYFNGGDNTFSTGTGYVSYQWYSGTSLSDLIPIPGAVSYNLAALYNEYYTVIVTDSFGCQSEASVYDMTDLSVNSLPVGNAVSIHPNPATSVLNISSLVSVDAVISDMAGKVIIDRKKASEIDISKLANGVYMIALYDGEGNQLLIQKLVKE